jgi:hypothetical protein
MAPGHEAYRCSASPLRRRPRWPFLNSRASRLCSRIGPRPLLKLRGPTHPSEATGGRQNPSSASHQTARRQRSPRRLETSLGWPSGKAARRAPGRRRTLAQWDILEFSRNAKHVSPDWPSGYWPPSGKSPSDKEWKSCLRKFAADAAAMQKLVANPKTDLAGKIPHGTGQTILRQALLLADHNSHHLGQIILVRRLLGAWPKS